MKRRWRTGWLLLAALLLGVALIACYNWPKQPRWQFTVDAPNESYQILQVDEAKRHLYLRYVDFSNLERVRSGNQHIPPLFKDEIRCYALDSCRLLWSKSNPSTASSSINEFNGLGDVILSPDFKQLAYITYANGEICLYDFPSFTAKAVIKFNELSPSEQIKANYSPQGDWLLSRTDKQIFIYDSRTALLLHQIDIPAEKVMNGGRGSWALSQDALICSPDRHYLIMANNMADNILVFDINSKKMIGECSGMQLPRLLGDGITLLCFPEFIQGNSQAKWHRINDDMVKKQTMTTGKIEGGFICCNDRHFLTARLNNSKSPPFWNDWQWIPDSFKMRLAQWLGLWNLQIEVTRSSNDTGEQIDRFPLTIAFGDMLPSSLQRNWLLNDSSQFLFNIGTSIALWDLPPSRPLLCWVSVSIIILISLWLAWPRRVQAQLTSHSVKS